MKIAVCMKRVPEIAEADVKVDGSGKDIVRDRLTFTINESDNYALEEALLLREKAGAEVVLVTVGGEETVEVLRMGLAKGADRAVRIDDSGLAGADGLNLARVLAAYIARETFDFVLTGSIAQDVEDSQVPPALAQYLGWPHAAYAVSLEPGDGNLVVKRELEGGFLEVKELALPCVVSVQTGGNVPRYASILGIKRAKSKPVDDADAPGLGLDPAGLGEAGSKTRLERLYVPEVVSAAEMLEGSAEETATKLAGILVGKGLV